MKEFITLTLGEKPWTFRALDLDQLEAAEPLFATINASVGTNGLMTKEVRNAVAELTCMSLQAKHPGTAVDDCRKLVTMGNFEAVIQAIAGISAIATAEPGSGNEVAGQ